MPLIIYRIAAAIALPSILRAHAGEPLEPHDLLTLQAWVLDPLIVVALACAAVLYWRGSSRSHGLRIWEVRCYWAGWTILAIALVSPLHAMGEVLFAAHMTQHELMMLAAAPLLVVARPVVAYLWAIPMAYRKAVVAVFASDAFQWMWRWASRPFHAWWLHGLALWLWHVPALYGATVSSDFVHGLQHLSFLLSALLFWWALLHGPAAKRGYGTAAMYLFGTALHSSILGALLTFAPTAWYPVYSQTTWAWGLTAVEDQQLGGLIMWVPAGVIYTIAGLILIALWLRESELRTSLQVSRIATMLLVLPMAGMWISCTRSDNAVAAEITGGTPNRGRELIGYYGCGSCHEIPGIPGAGGLVGPPLRRIAVRAYIAGTLPNTYENMARWIRSPQAVNEHTMMPNMYVTAEDARDISAYLYTLR